ncbi:MULTISPECIES: glycoside hydrolase family 5 protein [unclassified Lentimonas]|uniref:glycoside hydrolase family 5 protein n=1 Tax=unclassified Lentimonas TaxID=2630993 RepID=UPI001324AA01|nr:MULTISPECIES: cellulase family glycosylhydrolase [unclassified Lentimonas]CAA6679360.1 Unannotated [Lentimonas sp. CC4]CAA6687361.1 Unannotated [Lentimonas sp. CC6]CAA7078033.1 Unannotated [Lentimonas sp. CC4]CAA7168003.1 Unannotated [Lentimonas sp. CC21]CAA7179578.1 Unannotated [Lentimonas sp. CC8]
MSINIRTMPLLFIAVLFAGALNANDLPADFLKTSGTLIKNQGGQGEVVQLVGPNLGGWMLMESHMSPLHPRYADKNEKYKNVFDEVSLRGALDARFGEVKRWELINAFQDAFITEPDFEIIGRSGSNVVRLVIYYENHMDREGNWYPWKFERLKWAVEMARQYGMYTILDVHGPPGTPNGNDHSGQQTWVPEGVEHPTLTKNRVLNLYTDERRQQMYFKFLRGLAEEFVGNPAVAGYDILNEPKSDAKRDRPHLWPIMEQAYHTVREVDPDHIIFMMYAFSAYGFPDPQDLGLTNVVYSSHFYNDSAKIISKAREITDTFGVPVYVGEFHVKDGGKDGILEALTASGISYSWWSYKTWMNSMLKQVNGKANIPDVTSDSFEEIRTKWSNWRTSSEDSEISLAWMEAILAATDAPSIRHPE